MSYWEELEKMSVDEQIIKIKDDLRGERDAAFAIWNDPKLHDFVMKRKHRIIAMLEEGLLNAPSNR